MGKRGSKPVRSAAPDGAGDAAAARQQSVSAKGQESRTNRPQMSVGQSKTMRLKRSNQPHHGRGR